MLSIINIFTIIVDNTQHYEAKETSNSSKISKNS